MLLKIYSIRDTKAEYYTKPFFQKTHGEAERSFATLAKDSKTDVGAHPDDYDLFFLGEYDDLTGKLKTLDSPQHIVKANALIN